MITSLSKPIELALPGFVIRAGSQTTREVLHALATGTFGTFCPLCIHKRNGNRSKADAQRTRHPVIKWRTTRTGSQSKTGSSSATFVSADAQRTFDIHRLGGGGTYQIGVG